MSAINEMGSLCPFDLGRPQHSLDHQFFTNSSTTTSNQKSDPGRIYREDHKIVRPFANKKLF
jgi:hypothetical protein